MVRIKHRYLLVYIIYLDDPPKTKDNLPVCDLIRYHQPTVSRLSADNLEQAIKAQVIALFGDSGAGAIQHGLRVKYLSGATSTFILKVFREHSRLVWAALTFMDHVPIRNGRPCIFRVVHVSGTMVKLQHEERRQQTALVNAVLQDPTYQSSCPAGGSALDSLFGGEGGRKGVQVPDMTMADVAITDKTNGEASED